MKRMPSTASTVASVCSSDGQNTPPTMKFNGGCQFGQGSLTILRRIGLVIRCDQIRRIEHADLAASLRIDSRSFLSQMLSIFS